MAGFQALNEEVQGTLEILQGGEVIKALEKEDNSLYYPEGYWGERVPSFIKAKKLTSTLRDSPRPLKNIMSKSANIMGHRQNTKRISMSFLMK